MLEPLADAEIQTLATVFHRQASARQLLEAAGIPRRRQPAWQTMTAEEYWREVSASLVNGVVPDGRVRVLSAAAKMYPANPVLAGVADDRERLPSSEAEAGSADRPGRQPGAAGRYQVDARGASGLAVGDGVNQTNVFTN
jgi:hypothetical protein